MAQLENSGWDVEHIAIGEQKIGSGDGDFFFLIRNPDMCHVDDDNRRIAEAVKASDLTVYLSGRFLLLDSQPGVCRVDEGNRRIAAAWNSGLTRRSPTPTIRA
jgi:hypothetical protein